MELVYYGGWGEDEEPFSLKVHVDRPTGLCWMLFYVNSPACNTLFKSSESLPFPFAFPLKSIQYCHLVAKFFGLDLNVLKNQGNACCEKELTLCLYLRKQLKRS